MFGVLMLPISKANFRKLVTECLKGNHSQYNITTTLLTQNSWHTLPVSMRCGGHCMQPYGFHAHV